MPVLRSWPVLALLLLPATLPAQHLSADIIIGNGPVLGRIILGDPHPHYSRGIVAVRPSYRYRPVYHEVVVIHRHRGQGWYRRHGYRPVRVWYDSDARRYYHGAGRNHSGLRAIVVYERGGRYYGDGWEETDLAHRRTDHDRDEDRWERD